RTCRAPPLRFQPFRKECKGPRLSKDLLQRRERASDATHRVVAHVADADGRLRDGLLTAAELVTAFAHLLENGFVVGYADAGDRRRPVSRCRNEGYAEPGFLRAIHPCRALVEH